MKTKEAMRCDITTPAQGVYGFAAWLTSRPEAVTIGASHNCAVVAELCAEFCIDNDIDAADVWDEQHRRGGFRFKGETIGRIRRFLFVPWPSKWNAFVRDMTAHLG